MTTSIRKALPWVVAAAVAICALWLGQAYLLVRAENRLLQDQRTLSELARKASDAELMAERIVSQRLASQHPGAVAPVLESLEINPMPARQPRLESTAALLVWDPARKEGICLLTNAPHSLSGEPLTLWLLGETPVKASTFTLDANRSARIGFKAAPSTPGRLRVAISRERTPTEYLFASQ